MPNSISRIDFWSYAWGVLSTLLLFGAAAYVILKVRNQYLNDESEGCGWSTTLSEYQQLMERGLITKEEFQRIKKRLVSEVESVSGDQSLSGNGLPTDETNSNDCADPGDRKDEGVREDSNEKD